MASSQEQKVFVGAAGELLVLSRLLLCGFVAGLLPSGSKADDIYVERDSKPLRIQVKTRVGPLSWPTGYVTAKPDRFYALVHLDSLEDQDLASAIVHLVPSRVVAKGVLTHARLYGRAHPNQTGPGVLNVADPWSLSTEMAKHGFGPGWLTNYREPWRAFRDGTLR